MSKAHFILAMAICAALLATGVVTCLAQEAQTESIYIANTKVITIRDKGAYPSLRDRAVAIEKAVVDVISNQDTQNLTIAMKQDDELWTIYAGDVKLVSVQPAEAAANNLPEKTLGAVWVKNLRDAFPRATPCSKLPASAFQPKPGTGPVAVTPAVGEAPAPAGPAVTEEPVVPAVPAVAEQPKVIGAPELITRDAFNTVRALSEEEFLAKREELVAHLIADLTPFITGKVASAVVPTVEPATPAVTTPVTPAPAVVETPAPAETPVTPAPTAVVGPPPTTSIGIPAAENLPEVKSGDPAYAKVPQKNRIRKKLRLAQEPYLALRAEDAATAKPISDMLAACRSANARGDFDASEQYVDSALKLLGVEYTEGD